MADHSHDPFEESLEELNRIADDLVDGLSLEDDAPEDGLTAGPETPASPDTETVHPASTVEELTHQIEHPDAEDSPDDGPSGAEVADLFAHVDSLLAPQTEPEAAEESVADRAEAAAPDDAEPDHAATLDPIDQGGAITIDLDAADLEAAEEFVDELEAQEPEFEAPADANIDLPPMAESPEEHEEADPEYPEALVDEPPLEQPIAEFAEEPIGEFLDEPSAPEESVPDAGAIPWPPEAPGETQTMGTAGMTAEELALANSVAAAAEPVFERPTPRPSRTPWVIAAVFVIAALGVAAWWLLFQPPTPSARNYARATTAATQRATAPPPVRTAPMPQDALDGQPVYGPATDPALESDLATATVMPTPEEVDDAGTTFNVASGATPVVTPAQAMPSTAEAERKPPTAAKPTRSTVTPSPPVSTRSSAERSTVTPSPPVSTRRSAEPPARPQRTEEQIQRSFERLSSEAAVRASDSSDDSPSEIPDRRPDAAPAEVPPAGSTGPDVVQPETIPVTPQIQPFRPPEVLERVEPVYPPRALKRGESGTIVLKVLVDEEGGVARVVVEQGIDGSELEAAAIGAVLRWRYKPASENGHTIRGWTTETFVFDQAE